MTWAEIVEREVARARARYPRPFASAHEAYAVLREEVDEVWDLVKLRRARADQEYAWRVKLLAELVQVAAMARRGAEDLGLTEDAPVLATPGVAEVRGEAG